MKHPRGEAATESSAKGGIPNVVWLALVAVVALAGAHWGLHLF